MAPAQVFQATTSQLRPETGPRSTGTLRIQVPIIDLDPGQGNHPCRNAHTDDLTGRRSVPCMAGAETAKSPVNCRANALRSPKRRAFVTVHRRSRQQGTAGMLTATSDTSNHCSFVGIYDIPEAARYLNAAGTPKHPAAFGASKLIRWIRSGLIAPAQAETPGNELLINFHELISVRVIAALRQARVSVKEIKAAEHWLQERLEVEYPFATQNILTGRGQLFVEWQKVLVSGSRHGQMALEFLRGYLIPARDLAFDEHSGLVSLWEPSEHVALDPLVQFGAPCIKGTRTPTRSIAGMVLAGEPEASVARDLELTIDEVRAAMAWERKQSRT